MNEVTVNGDKRMTVKEIAEAFGVPERTLHNSIDRLFPGIKKNGVATLLYEEQVSELAIDLQRAHNSTLATTGKVIETDLEMMMLDKQVSEWKTRKIEELQLQLQDRESRLSIAAPKVESFDALQRSEKTMSITDAAKHFDLHVKTQVYPYLRAMKYLNQDDTPSQSALDAGYLAIRQARCHDGEFRPQAVVLASQLETWRTRVVPQIARWIADV